MARSRKGRDFPLHERIRYLRNLREMTQSEMAKKAGISQGSLAHFESGRASPSVKTLMAMAEALDINTAIFFVTDDVLVFDLKKIRSKYPKAEDLPDRLYRDLNTVVMLGKKMGLG